MILKKNSKFDNNLIDYHIIKRLRRHNFNTYPSEYYYRDYNEFLNRKQEVVDFLNYYYNKLKKYVDIKQKSNYNYAEIKDKYLNTKNKKFLDFLIYDVNNFNSLSAYYTNLSYLENYKINENTQSS